jgi:hypothetical protein
VRLAKQGSLATINPGLMLRCPAKGENDVRIQVTKALDFSWNIFSECRVGGMIIRNGRDYYLKQRIDKSEGLLPHNIIWFCDFGLLVELFVYDGVQ